MFSHLKGRRLRFWFVRVARPSLSLVTERRSCDAPPGQVLDQQTFWALLPGAPSFAAPSRRVGRKPLPQTLGAILFVIPLGICCCICPHPTQPQNPGCPILSVTGVVPKEITHRQVDWPTGSMDRTFGEHGFAFMSCGQDLRPGEYSSTNVVHAGAKFRCALNTQGKDGSVCGDGRWFIFDRSAQSPL